MRRSADAIGDIGAAPAKRRRNLVIVRAGDTSLHPMWLQGAQDRSWDLLVSYFGDDSQKYRGPNILRVDGKGPKWPALKSLINSHWDYIGQYDYIWLPDDDIACRNRDIERLFALTREYRLALSQPALRLDSYFSWVVTLRNPLLRMRFVNFVEIMVPCFEREFLARCLPHMSENLSGWGLDHLWADMLRSQRRRMAIIDAAPVTHTRPLGAANYRFLRDRGLTAHDEAASFKRAHALGDTIIKTEAAVTIGGLHVERGSIVLAALLRWGYRYAVARAYALRRAFRWELGKRARVAIASPFEFEEW